MLARTPTTAAVCGTQGRLEVAGPFFCPADVRLYDREGALVDTYVPAGDFEHEGLRFEAAEAARCLQGGATESALMPLASTLRVMQTMDDVRRQLGVRYPNG